MNSKKLLVISGPSGSGKSTVAKKILERYPEFEFSVSSTTREKRSNEINGKDYYFINIENFKEEAERGEFIEYEEVYDGVFYGTSKKEISRIFNDNKIPLLDIDVKGALSIKRIYGSTAYLVFIHPGSIQTLRERLIKRNTDLLNVIEKRLAKAEFELSFTDSFDSVVKNDNELEVCLDEIQNLLNNVLLK